MSDWEKLDPKEAKERLGPEGVKSAEDHAREAVARSKILYRSRVKSPRGLVVVMLGPITPVVDVDESGAIKPMPPSACPLGYTIIWYGERGSDYPDEVDNNVLMKLDQNGCKGQVWAVDNRADAVRIIEAAFGIDAPLPPEEPRS